MPLTTTAIATGVIGATKLVKGFIDRKNDLKRSKYNVRPAFQIPDENYENQRLAENMATSGLPDATRNYYNTAAERGLGSGLSALLTAGYGVNDIQGLYDSYNRNEGQLAAEDAQMRSGNIRYLIDQNSKLADQKTQQWALNYYEPYKDKAKAISESLKQDSANISGGINDIVGAGTSWATGNLYKEAAPKALSSASSVLAPGAAQVVASSPAIIGDMTTPVNVPTTDRSGMIDSILKRYQNSPYYPQLNNYLGQTA